MPFVGYLVLFVLRNKRIERFKYADTSGHAIIFIVVDELILATKIINQLPVGILVWIIRRIVTVL